MAIAKYLAELVGTFILVVVGSMSIVAAGLLDAPVLVVVPFGFGLGLLIALYAVGHVSGGHFNPAVTVGMWLDRRTTTTDLIGYLIGQVAGAVVASAVLLLLSSQEAVAGTITRFEDTGTGLTSEIVLTTVFVLVILSSTRWAPRAAPTVIALSLVAVHFAGIAFSGASVNPARSFGPALIATDFSGFWVYVVGPAVGALLAWVLHRLFPVVEPQP